MESQRVFLDFIFFLYQMIVQCVLIRVGGAKGVLMNDYIKRRVYEVEANMLRDAEKWASQTTDKNLRRRLCRLMHTLSQDMARLRNVIQGVSLLVCFFMATSVFAQAPRSLPKFVQNLSQENFAAWANWQNAQTEKRSADPATVDYERPYLPGVRTTATTSKTTTFTGSSNVEGGNFSSRRGFTRNGFSSNNASVSSYRNNTNSGYRGLAGSTSTESRVFNYRNPFYNSPPPIILYNPFVKPTTGKGEPDWRNIFIPHKGKIVTVQEALEQADGPIHPETLFTNAMKTFLGD
jgi:predicted nucleic acid binding AN1-type Zn finger protein